MEDDVQTNFDEWFDSDNLKNLVRITTSSDSNRIFPFEEIVCPIASNEVDWIYLIIHKSKRTVTIHDSSTYSKLCLTWFNTWLEK